METQNYKNHIRYYPPHHFFFYGFAGIIFGLSVYSLVKNEEQTLLWSIITAIVFMIIWLSFMLRQHYSLGNQNRIARLELRFRYYTLTQKHFEEKEQQLSLSQILALRFASNEELVALTERAINEKLSPDEIKRSVKHWVPDYMRV
jgi:murein DD-endopeptidase MepM/ murein hydrolase activator NlpD